MTRVSTNLLLALFATRFPTEYTKGRLGEEPISIEDLDIRHKRSPGFSSPSSISRLSVRCVHQHCQDHSKSALVPSALVGFTYNFRFEFIDPYSLQTVILMKGMAI